MINRSQYLNQLIAFQNQKIIKVVTGVRRCGKSTLFSLYRDYLLKSGIDEKQIISVNLEALEFESLLDYKVLYQFIKDNLCQNQMTYVFIDEVQQCENFEKVVDSLFIKDLVDIYITGSNAYMLSGEMATLLSGRYITVDMLPLSFKEYIEMVATANRNLEALFNDYLKFGSFPYVAQISYNPLMVLPYLEGIYNTILIKDVATRTGITDIAVLESIVKMLASSIGSPISVKKIADTIQSSGRKISVNTVDTYVSALTDSYIFYKVDRYDIKGRQHLKTLGKYYIIDTGIRQLLLSQRSEDIGHIIENIVYFELRRRGGRINIGKLDQTEVDFVVSGPNGVIYYQVAASVLDESTLKRELEPLNRINDHYPKYLLTLDRVGEGMNYNGIKRVNLIDWLLS